ncbi:hypothetical protein TELCIR_05547 [Teladorsagia circumcincta]|uniref:Uncharacterized protein n=1 Tax=Teladorsagia circumcincta TaxID=45464 RepID=A0A2G9UQM9_TELCI|nr:hypothetical protein TELCIR_05547 [Teladorsagia circumcincta]
MLRVSNYHPKEPRRPRSSHKDRATLSRNERHDHSREEIRHESPRKSNHPPSPNTSPKRRKLSTSSLKSDAQNSVDDDEEALVVSDIDLVVVDEDEVEDGEILD